MIEFSDTVHCGNTLPIPRSLILPVQVTRDQRHDRLLLCFIEPAIVDRLPTLSLLTVIRGLTRVPEANDLVRFIITRDRLTVSPAIPLLVVPTLFHHAVGKKLPEPVLCVYIAVQRPNASTSILTN